MAASGPALPTRSALTPATSSITTVRIDSTTGVHIDEHDYVKHKRLHGGYLLPRLDIPEIIEESSFKELSELLDARQTAWAERLEIVEAFLLAERDGSYSRSDASLNEFTRDLIVGKIEKADGRFGHVSVLARSASVERVGPRILTPNKLRQRK